MTKEEAPVAGFMAFITALSGVTAGLILHYSASPFRRSLVSWLAVVLIVIALGGMILGTIHNSQFLFATTGLIVINTFYAFTMGYLLGLDAVLNPWVTFAPPVLMPLAMAIQHKAHKQQARARST